MLNKTANLIETLFVYPERMLTNLESTHGLIFSGQLLLDLVEHGVSREDAYRLVQSHAMRAWKEGLDFHQLVLHDKEITSKVPRKQIEYAFDLSRQLKNVDKIFARVFEKKKAVKNLFVKKKTATLSVARESSAKKKQVETKRGSSRRL
jgi:adenylosuccinate lyase